MPPRIAVVGSINLDLVTGCDELPRPGETARGTALERVPGGKGANQAVAAARLGAAVRMIGCVGDDVFAGEALAGLEAAGVALHVRTVPGPTGVALVLVDARGETLITVVPGANGAVRPEDVALRDGEAVLCQLEIPGDAVAAAARDARGFFCLNAAPPLPLPPEVLDRADLVVVNRHEYEALGRRRSGLVALTLGSEGAILLDGGREVARARAPVVGAVDGTAAGDAFTACLTVSIVDGLGHGKALERACVAGALAASRPGAQPSLPTAAEVDAMLRG